jgi:hypothetical protein
MPLDDKKVKVYSLLMDSFLKLICGLTVLFMMVIVFFSGSITKMMQNLNDTDNRRSV